MKNLRENQVIYFLSALVFVTAVIWYFAVTQSFSGKMTVAFLDVGQGDSIFVESPSGNKIIVDGGPDGKILPELSKILPFYDHSISAIMITNPDDDHFAGFLDLLKSYKVGAVLEPGTRGASSVYTQFENKIAEEKIPRIIARKGMDVLLGGGAELSILFPDRDVSNWATNDGSIISKLSYDITSVMLEGDAPQKDEEHLLAAEPAEELRSDILKVGHHGSKTSSAPDYIAAVAPAFDVISAALKNRYGLPDKPVLDILAGFGGQILETFALGTIVFESDGKTIKLR